MLPNYSQSIQEEVFVEWVNTCPVISHPCSSIADLSNGVLLLDVLTEIDSTWFKPARSTDMGGQWLLKHSNLKRLVSTMSRYYEQILGIPFDKISHVNLTDIAKFASVQEILKLCQLVLYITVASDNNAMVVQRLQQLPQQSQGVVMHCIEQIDSIRSASTGHPTAQPSSSGSVAHGGTPRSSFNEEPTYRNQNDITRLAMEKEELEASYRKLIEEHAQLRYKYDELEFEKRNLQLRLQEMDKAVTQANETGRTDSIMRTEIEHLKQDLQKSEDRRQEAEVLLEQQTMAIEELTQKGEELKERAEQTSRLKDQLDESRHAAEKLQKAENTLDEQNHSLMERNQQIENEYRNVLGFRSLMDSYKDQVATLETKNNELLREKNKMDYEIQRMVKKVDLLELDKARDSERILALEDHLQDLQLGGGRRSTAGMDRKKDTDPMDLDDYGDIAMNDGDDDDDDIHLGGSLEDSLTENNVVELKRSNRRLERQVRALQQEGGSTADSNQNMMVLQHLLDDSNRLKAQFEKNYLDVSQERDILQSDMARVRQGIPDSLMDESSSTMSARLNIMDLEKENRKLRDEKAKLEQKVKEARANFGKDGIDTLDGLDDFKAQYKQMEQKALLLEQQTKKQLQDINKLLLEKDMLQSQSIDQKDLLLDKERLYSEMKASLAVFEAQEDEPLKQQNAQLQQRTIKQQEQLRELQLKLKKTKEFVIQQDKMLKESKLNGTSGNYDEAVSSLKSELALRDEENDRLKKQLHETRLQARREQQLMMSAWYDIARHTRKDLPSNKSFITKVKLGKAQKQNRPLPHWFRLKSDTKIRWNAKRRNWRHTKLNI